jgi:NAD(P)-dependent dehydrogenase (short-subunit alcohol dehydrogenase family)
MSSQPRSWAGGPTTEIVAAIFHSLERTERAAFVTPSRSVSWAECLVEGLIESGYQISTFSRNRTNFTDQYLNHPGVFFESADICDSPALARFLSNAKERFGLPYGLVNCAGVATVGVLPLLRDEQIDQAIATNLRGTITLTRLVCSGRCACVATVGRSSIFLHFKR